MATPRLVELIDRNRSAHGVSGSVMARRIGFSRENLRKWRIYGASRLPDRTNLTAVARVIGRPYREVLSAALFETEYLTDDQAAIPRPYGEVLHDPVSVLTEAKQLTNRPMCAGLFLAVGNPTLTRSAPPIDWAEFVTLALAGAAANIGSVEKIILAGRLESWEAEVIRKRCSLPLSTTRIFGGTAPILSFPKGSTHSDLLLYSERAKRLRRASRGPPDKLTS